MKRIMKAAVIALCVSGIGSLVTALPAAASDHVYWSGDLIQNQVQESPRKATTGGSITSQLSVVRVRATVRSLASFEGLGNASYSHARLTTSAYCQFRFTNYDVGLNRLTCRLNY